MKAVNTVSFVLVLVGALNWGLVGLAHFDLVAAIFGMQFGETSPLTSVIYALVGVSALVQAATLGQRAAVGAPAHSR